MLKLLHSGTSRSNLKPPRFILRNFALLELTQNICDATDALFDLYALTLLSSVPKSKMNELAASIVSSLKLHALFSTAFAKYARTILIHFML